MPCIKQLVNGETISVVAFDDILELGRARTNGVVIDDPTVSQLHAKIFREKGSWILQDCDSTNGILVDGTKQKRITLVDGCLFSIGTQVIEFRLSEPDRLDKTLRIKKSWIPGVYYTE